MNVAVLGCPCSIPVIPAQSLGCGCGCEKCGQQLSGSMDLLTDPASLLKKGVGILAVGAFIYAVVKIVSYEQKQ